MKIKTSNLTGAALDWAVAKCEGYSGEQAADIIYCDAASLAYSTDWAQGGPIIERYCINLYRLDPKTEDDDRFWLAHIDGSYCRHGVSALTAAMRCFVASKLGDEVEIPDELAS